MTKTTTKPRAEATRTLRFYPNRDDVSPVAGLLVIAVGRDETAYTITESPSDFPGRVFTFAKVVGGEASTVFCSHRGPEADSCDCPSAFYRPNVRVCRHRSAVRKLLELGRI